jgi:hypothetical protein
MRSRILHAEANKNANEATQRWESFDDTGKMTQWQRGHVTIFQNKLFYGTDRGNSAARIQAASAR